MDSELLVTFAGHVAVVASVVAWGAWLWLVVKAFGESILSGILCFICGIYALYYAITRWSNCKTPFLVSLSFSLIAFACNVVVAVDMARHETGQNQWSQLLGSVYANDGPRDISDAILQADLDRMQGRWNIMSRRVLETFEIESNTCLITLARSQEMFDFKLVAVDGYRAVDLVSKLTGKVTKGIYVLEGSRLRICLGAPGGERPTDFAARNDEQELFILKRPWS